MFQALSFQCGQTPRALSNTCKKKKSLTAATGSYPALKGFHHLPSLMVLLSKSLKIEHQTSAKAARFDNNRRFPLLLLDPQR